MAENNWKRALEFLKATSLLMHFVGKYSTLLEAGAQRAATPDAALDLAEICLRLETADPSSVGAWSDLARVARHLQHALEDRDHPVAPLVAELHEDLLKRRDAMAARTEKGVR